ncbi:MAG: Twin-arginine translocation protein TatA [Actinomycetia bacterium]|jgi:sec-independent protein translocase protein TatA|nr:Twin-arginine translocation protein TatA [Actinomycetes bacterium]MDX6335423.1 sec-independent protein translocase protein TatA [Streptosporangiaceae bacterium]
MIGDLFDSPWKILIVAVVLIVLFGSKKLPDAARSLGKSMRILKTEVQDLHHDEKAETEKPAPAITAQPTQQHVDQLQQQIQDLQAKTSAAEAAKVSGAPITETQHTQAG